MYQTVPKGHNGQGLGAKTRCILITRYRLLLPPISLASVDYEQLYNPARVKSWSRFILWFPTAHASGQVCYNT
jgi:hypothetical protein